MILILDIAKINFILSSDFKAYFSNFTRMIILLYPMLYTPILVGIVGITQKWEYTPPRIPRQFGNKSRVQTQIILSCKRDLIYPCKLKITRCYF